MTISSILIFALIICSCSLSPSGRFNDDDMLIKALNALLKALQFMENNISSINLDGVYGVRAAEETLQAFLEHRAPMIQALGDDLLQDLVNLQKKAEKIADEAIGYVKINEPEYYEIVGFMLNKSDILLWYPSRKTNPFLQVEPVSCDKSHFNEDKSDECFRQIIENSNNKSHCNMKQECLDMMAAPRQRDYSLTHQVLYFQTMEKKNCTYKLKNFSNNKFLILQETMCANVMRDATMIENYNFPLTQRDIFMEQIGLCGIWGFKDFYKKEWLEHILKWQQPLGCYSNYAKSRCYGKILWKNLKFSYNCHSK